MVSHPARWPRPGAALPCPPSRAECPGIEVNDPSVLLGRPPSLDPLPCVFVSSAYLPIQARAPRLSSGQVLLVPVKISEPLLGYPARLLDTHPVLPIDSTGPWLTIQPSDPSTATQAAPRDRVIAVDSRFGKLAGKPPRQQATSTPRSSTSRSDPTTLPGIRTHTRRRAVARDHSGFGPPPRPAWPGAEAPHPCSYPR
jgi:hypothetical protein